MIGLCPVKCIRRDPRFGRRVLPGHYPGATTFTMVELAAATAQRRPSGRSHSAGQIVDRDARAPERGRVGKAAWRASLSDAPQVLRTPPSTVESAFPVTAHEHPALDELVQVIRRYPDRVHDPNVRQLAAVAQPVDGRVANAEVLGDLGYLEQPVAPAPDDRLDSTPPSVCKDCAGLSTVGSPCDGSGPVSGPKGRRFKSSPVLSRSLTAALIGITVASWAAGAGSKRRQSISLLSVPGARWPWTSHGGRSHAGFARNSDW
jgi:hypothetical protein